MLADHIEEYLGEILTKYAKDQEGNDVPFLVAHCPSGIESVRVFCTIGLSNYPLDCRGKHILQELMFEVLHKHGVRNYPAILQQLGKQALEKQTAFAPGDIVELPYRIFEDRDFHSFYATRPGFMPEEFLEYKTGDGDKVTFTILLPVSPQEEKYIKKYGYERFDILFIESGVDMLDPERKSIV